MDVTIRNARHDDLEPMTALLAELFSIEADFVVDENRQKRGLTLMLDGCGKHRCIKVADLQGRVVGMVAAQLLISTSEGAYSVLIEDMVVSRDYRRQGIGRRLLAAIDAWSSDREATRLQLLADRTNFSALDFYDRIGWRPTRMICLRKNPPATGGLDHA